MLTALAVANYRSIRDLVLPLGPLTVITGPNGSGKSSLYRSLRLLADVARGEILASLAREGGLPSTLWARPETPSRAMQAGDVPFQGTVRKKPVSLRLGFASETFGYAVDLGLPSPSSTAFHLDPDIKREVVWAGPVLRPSTVLVDRGRNVLQAVVDDEKTMLRTDMPSHDSLFTAADPRKLPELWQLGESMRSWRFYDQVRTDVDAPARRPQVGTRTWRLAGDGADLAAAILTVRESGDGAAFDECIHDAFPNARVVIAGDNAWFEVQFEQRGLLRPLAARELSDGTLRYILWAAALLSPRPPELLVVNEPETSLHPELLPALARLLVRAAERTQVLVVSHAPALVAAMSEAAETVRHDLVLEHGETRLGATSTEAVSWRWPTR